ncbi:hypothetical protein PUNSTDRAFT_109187 [Punctularia strigosozonata HHB-11173 SS5]|uniref:Oxidase ustYa n=1 Tax=Punctularia strigosozonata (strain HHB-11173) TaxID=741275 RepID=R7S0P1_PUNST|nr:uncharacterized protein PUNSTDRAFT_109187 [Punctularia strigosozonata HHB-11173 SS5]EIN03773.1 hypothetical protein PUNSTDRAFT_109187 [Punctularia strigosozonata HHB-11173 SS5]
MQRRKTRTETFYVAAVMLLTAVTAVDLFLRLRREQLPTASEERNYTWIGNDHPARLDLDLPPARMLTEETVHYQLDADAEWASIFPLGGGFVRLGPHKRAFGLSIFHQFHCLDNIRLAIMESNKSRILPTHLAHCFAYLRQMVMCRSDTFLEPLLPPYEEKHVNSWYDHECLDWSVVYDAVERNFEEFNSTHSSRETEDELHFL